MSMIQVLVLLVSYFVCGFTAPTRISVSCDRNGFNCNKIVNNMRLVIYQCPSNTKHIIAYLWSFGEPSNTAWITIRNCENVDLDMSCTSFRRSIHTLTIENSTNLRFIRSVTTIKNPAKLVLRNIKNIEVIPENTFTIPYMVKYNGEAKEHELQEIDFENVHIGTIEGHAFHSLRGFRNFTWRNVGVDRLHAKAIKIAFNTTYPTQGKFVMSNSTVEIAEYLSFQLYVKKATFQNNKFVEIMPGGINGTIETFNFVNNKINTLQAGSISILSKTVNILDNTFDYLKSGCLEKISPGLLVDSHTSFGNLEFIYKFNNNNIINVDAGSLNPDMEAYSKVSTDFIFSFNTFLCTCENIGWLVSKVGHGYNSVALQDFYDSITEDNGSNICSGLSCRKSINSIKHLLDNGRCSPDLSMENFCRLTTSTTSKSQSASKKSDSDELVGITWINRTELLRSGGNKLFFNLVLLLLTVVVNITTIL